MAPHHLKSSPLWLESLTFPQPSRSTMKAASSLAFYSRPSRKSPLYQLIWNVCTYREFRALLGS